MLEVNSLISRILPKGKFARGVAVLMTGTASSQIIVVLAAPLLTRFYTPNDFGLLAVFSGLLANAGVVAGLRYELAIPLPSSNREASHLTILSLLMVVCMTMLTSVIVSLFGTDLAIWLKTTELTSYLWLLPIGVFGAGVYQSFYYWATRTHNFTDIAHTRLTQSLFMVTIQVGASVFGPVALLSGQIIGQAMGGLKLALSAFRHPEFKLPNTLNLVQVANSYRKFPIYDSWSGLFNTASVQLPPILFTMYFNPALAGLYFLAHRVLTMPISLICSAVGNVTLANAAEAYQNRSLNILVKRVHDTLAHFIMPPTFILIISGPDLFAFVFGSEWREAGVYARWMAVWLYFVFVTSPLSTIPLVMGKQLGSLKFNFSIFITRMSAIILGGTYFNAKVTVIMFSLSSAIFWFIFLLWLASICKLDIASIMITTADALLWSFMISIPIMLSYMLSESKYIIIAGYIVTTIFVLIRYVVILKRNKVII